MKATTILVVIGLTAMYGMASAQQFHPSPTIDELIDRSDRVVIGSVRGMYARMETVTLNAAGKQGQIPFTYFTVLPSESLKGAHTSEPITMRMLGAQFDGYAIVTTNQPDIHEDERVLLFMRELNVGSSEPIYQVAIGRAGKFGIRTERGVDVVYRDRTPNGQLMAADVPAAGPIPLSTLRSLVTTATRN